MTPGADMWFNTVKYTPAQLWIFCVGCFLWVICYVAVIRHALREKFLVIPAAAVVANISWEWLWGFFYKPDMGLVVWWGYRIWGVLDVAILIFLYKYGSKQLLTATGKKYFPHAVTFGLIAWFASLYFFIGEGYDMAMGATSAYIINTMMSAVYIVMVVKHPEIRKFSFTVAWTKCLGTALNSVFMFIAPLTLYGAPDVPAKRGFLLTLCVLAFILDVVFLAAFWMRLRAPDTPVEAIA